MQEVLNKSIRELYTTNFRIKKEEKVLVFTDTLLPDEDIAEADRGRRGKLPGLAGKVAEIGTDICQGVAFLTYPSLKAHGSEPPERIWVAAFGEETVGGLEREGLLKKLINKEGLDQVGIRDINRIVRLHKADAVNAVIALSNFSTTHTKFRELLTNICGARYASMPLFDEAMFYGPMQVDWNALRKRTDSLTGCLNGAEKIFISAPGGTELAMGVNGRMFLADTGDLSLPGAFGNLPAGEVFVAPVEGTTEGTVVLEWAPTARLTSPVTVKIEKGLVKNVSGKDPYARKLEAKLKENPDFRNIAELGIGTNDMAKRADNILESEKILGTIHIAFGDNSTFGGIIRTPFHQDFVIFNPTVKLLKGKEEKVILKKGRLLL